MSVALWLLVRLPEFLWLSPCVCGALPSIPTRTSSMKEVEHWLEAFATLKGIPLDDLQVFARSGRSLLALTKCQCCELSPDWGDMIYTALSPGIVDSGQLSDLAGDRSCFLP